VPKDDFDFGLGKNDGADAFAELGLFSSLSL